MSLFLLFLFLQVSVFAAPKDFCAAKFLDNSHHISNDKNFENLHTLLVQANQYLEQNKGELTLEHLIEKGFVVVDKKTPVLRNGQPMPFDTYHLPFALTGFYRPKYRVSAQTGEAYFANLIILPGTGSTKSDVTSILDVASTFAGKKKSANKNILNQVSDNHLKFRVNVFAADLPYLGLGKSAPFEFGHPELMMKVVNHIHQISEIISPHLPTFIAGRSQGGLAALEYASLNKGIRGVVALSPSHADKRVMKYTENNLQTMLDDDKFGEDFDVDNRSWNAYLKFTSLYKVYSKKSKSNVLIQAGEFDDDYPREVYQKLLKDFSEKNPNAFFSLYKKGFHNLWNRREESFYQRAISEMAQFMYRNL